MVWPYAHLEWHAGPKCAARGSPEMQDPKDRQKVAIWGTITQFCRAISSQLRHLSTIAKMIVNSDISSTSPHNMVNFDPLAAEIGPVVWGTPANFNRLCVLLLHGTPNLVETVTARIMVKHLRRRSGLA